MRTTYNTAWELLHYANVAQKPPHNSWLLLTEKLHRLWYLSVCHTVRPLTFSVTQFTSTVRKKKNCSVVYGLKMRRPVKKYLLKQASQSSYILNNFSITQLSFALQKATSFPGKPVPTTSVCCTAWWVQTSLLYELYCRLALNFMVNFRITWRTVTTGFFRLVYF